MDAFGSIGLYNTDGYCKENKYNAYSVNTINATPNEDGSLTFYIQKESPGKELEANWLPAPDGPFYVTMRLYGPQKEALEGTWVNPPLVKVSKN